MIRTHDLLTCVSSHNHSTRAQNYFSLCSSNFRFVADTQCTKHPRQFCAATGCKFEAGERECHNKTVQSAVDVPEESCDLVPQKTCQVTALFLSTDQAPAVEHILTILVSFVLSWFINPWFVTV